MFSATEITKVAKRSGCCLPRLALFAFFAAFAENPEIPVIPESPENPAIIIDRFSEIVLPAGAPFATRLAAEELNFFLARILGAPLPIVVRRIAGKTAIVLGADGGSPGRLAPPCGHAGRMPLPDDFAAIAIPSLFYQIETWLPKPKGDHGSHQALFMIAAPDGITVERLDVRTGGKIAPDIEWGVHKQGPRKDNPPTQTLRPL